VTYGRIAYRCVWLKARWPTAFLAAMLRNDAGYYDKGVYVEEAKRLGATFLPPCVNLADAEFALAAPDAIRTGLQEVRGLSQRTLDTLLQARAAGGPFRSLDDFLQRVRPARDEAENLILCGGFDGLQRTRPELLWRLQVALSPKTQRERTAAAAPGALFAEALAPRDLAFPDLPEHGPAMRTRCELEVLGFALGAHPVDVLWRQPPAAAKYCVPCGKLEERIGQHVATFGWAVAYRRHRSESGESMLFVTLEDGTGIVEVVLFPRAFQSFGGELQGRGPFVVSGVVEERMGGVALRASGVQAVGET
jgi:DNA polymerase-3 subunit alpha